MGKSQRNKGKRGELDAIHQLEALTGLTLHREYGQAAAGGHDCTLTLPGAVLCLEVKRQEDERHSQWWAQAVAQAWDVDGGVPVVIWRRNRQPWRVRVPIGWLMGNEWPWEPMDTSSAILTLEAFAQLINLALDRERSKEMHRGAAWLKMSTI